MLIRFNSRTGLFCCFLAVLFCPCLTFGQKPGNDSIRDVEVCETLKDPAAFDGQKLRFRGRLELEPEDNTINDDACGLPVIHTRIWWQYAGDSTLPTEAKRAQGVISPVLKDAAFDQFQTRTQEHRAKRPDGEQCASHRECAYYDVVATYTGRFLAAKIQPGSTQPGGFGHMGCCHLFVIERVSEVVAQRTQVPSDNQKFTCTTMNWESEYPALGLPDLDARIVQNKQFLIDQARPHGDGSLIEAVGSDSPRRYLGLTGYLTWSSPDLLTTYAALIPQFAQPKKPRKKQDTRPVPIIVDVAKEHCEPVAQ